jgi:hypothetical protein
MLPLYRESVVRAPVSGRSQRSATRQTKRRADHVDRRDLVVDQAAVEADALHFVEHEVGRHPRRALRPSDPQATGRIEAPGEGGKPSRQFGATGDEEQDHVEVATRLGAQRDVRRQRRELAREALRRRHHRHPAPLVDAELARQRRARIPGVPRHHVPSHPRRCADSPVRDALSTGTAALSRRTSAIS